MIQLTAIGCCAVFRLGSTARCCWRMRARAAAGASIPIHVSAGLAWEAARSARSRRAFWRASPSTRGPPLAPLGVDMRDVYPADHWAIRGEPPAYDTPDEDVYLEGRNIVLLSKASVFMARLAYHGLAHRSACRQSVSRRDAGVLRSDGAARCRSGSTRQSRSRRLSRAMKKADVIRLGMSARRSVRVDAVVHAAARRSTLRSMQQMPGAHRGVQRGRVGGSGEICALNVLIVDGRLLINGTALHVRELQSTVNNQRSSNYSFRIYSFLSLMAPSPVRMRS